MELFQVEITGFRKFKDKTILKTRGKVVAILGPNEAGKSSLLRAIDFLDVNQEYGSADRSRDADESLPIVKATYSLSQDDRAKAGISIGNWFDITKYASGERKWSIRPTPPDRDYSHRPKLARKFSKLSKKARALISDMDEDLLSETVTFFEDNLSAEDELSDGEKNELSSLSSRWASIAEEHALARMREMSDAISEAAKLETTESKRLAAGRTLWDQLPQFLLFSEEDRDLKASYLWSELAASIPTALSNLAKVAELDLKKLIHIATSNPNDPEIDTLMERVNTALEQNFQSAWNQSKVSVALAYREQSLLIQVYNNDRARTDFAQRSDGLRQFVALRCFTAARQTNNIVLLVDEAEQHLHYDAQADLVQMLSGQTVASKVIYTTHSLGCLPEDLGNGVRLVIPTAENSDWSKIENKFWATRQKEEAAFSPILMGMGASTMAFFPTRAAVLVEGPSDTILLPSMFREALGRSSLGAQFVHGLSEDGHVSLPILNSTGTTVCYLLDNDAGGRLLGEQLAEKGVDARRVCYLPSKAEDTELEDFLDSELLADAVARQLRLPQNERVFEGHDLPKYGKWDAICSKCEELGAGKLRKVSIAYEVLDILDQNPERTIIDKRLKSQFRATANRVLLKLNQPN